jgi:hypothetical protein
MREDQHKFLMLLGQLPARLTAEQAAWVLNCGPHDIPALMAVEILIGSDADLVESKAYLHGLSFDCDVPIHILTVSLDDHRTEIFRANDRNA